MLTVVARIKVKEAAVPRFIEALGPLVAGTRAEAGCSLYEFNQSNAAPGEFVVYEKWADQAALDEHMTTPRIKAFSEAVVAELDGPPAIELFTTIA